MAKRTERIIARNQIYQRATKDDVLTLLFIMKTDKLIYALPQLQKIFKGYGTDTINAVIRCARSKPIFTMRLPSCDAIDIVEMHDMDNHGLYYLDVIDDQ